MIFLWIIKACGLLLPHQQQTRRQWQNEAGEAASQSAKIRKSCRNMCM